MANKPVCNMLVKARVHCVLVFTMKELSGLFGLGSRNGVKLMFTGCDYACKREQTVSSYDCLTIGRRETSGRRKTTRRRQTTGIRRTTGETTYKKTT